VADRLLADPGVRGANRVALYAALPDELPTRPLFEALRSAGVRCLLPRIRDGGLSFVAVAEWEALAPGKYGVLAPPPDLAAEQLAPGDVAIVPGVAFDRRGNRLGRGGGHYDRTFAEAGPHLIGAGYALQIVPEVPVDSRDRSMDAIVTERELRWLAGRA